MIEGRSKGLLLYWSRKTQKLVGFRPFFLYGIRTTHATYVRQRNTGQMYILSDVIE